MLFDRDSLWVDGMELTLNSNSNNPENRWGSQWKEIWSAVCKILEDYIVSNQLHAWIFPLELGEVEELDYRLRIRLVAPNDFSKNWVLDQHKKVIESALGQVTGQACDLEVIVNEATTQIGVETRVEERTRANEVYEEEYVSSAGAVPIDVLKGVVIQTGNKVTSGDNFLDARYVFENYVVGASNQFAHASAIAVAEQPARQYNPLFIYSPPGLGKTHLLHAIGNHYLKNNANARVAYLSAEKFVNELIESLQHRKMSQFRMKYRDS